ncbi:MAG: pyridoxal-phosphate dependent enzyme [Bacteroidota bacterium]|nr:pyridoxal-phosphate dependent enzyme [Bacteroidota bacterium]
MDETQPIKTLPIIGNKEVPTDRIDEPVFFDKGIEVSMLRLDCIHPVVSGNKIFKLVYYLREAGQLAPSTLITQGGPYSNHLAAASYACRVLGIRSIGLVRGEKPQVLSHTLQFCMDQGMTIQYLSRSDYRQVGTEDLTRDFGTHILVPEGGFGRPGVKGAALINQYIDPYVFTHLSVPVGSATTLAGLLQGSSSAPILAFPALRNMLDIGSRLEELGVTDLRRLTLIPDYHFGGFAKKDASLIRFMNEFYLRHQIPLDFVYTAKMMYGIFDLIAKGYFPKGSRILCLHTGGLQGNESLAAGTLNF